MHYFELMGELTPSVSQRQRAIRIGRHLSMSLTVLTWMNMHHHLSLRASLTDKEMSDPEAFPGLAVETGRFVDAGRISV